ncbi:hypothetical protein R2R35_18355 [Anaerocolumna sp. AGMB13020]|uniref:hypothetical protein n=1 Tax=Anaerocolumna sp. AGMB13020 TaxID=3081750 RepID=UPI002952D452|nr:hypothetical protein [Anaerocolumna sp. AGMB13020]WOO35743.1 hypothetical protein R2R35_18355 [Anaerocolumna sp. AGMB13020]
MNRKRIIFIAITLLIVITLALIVVRLNFITQTDKDITIGMIDGSVSKNYDNVIMNTNNKSDYISHGDHMIDFANICNSKNKIYYFDASINGEISTESIIEGLEWMIENSVSKVNLSLSSKIYSEQLNQWINDHKDDIEIYASYNNNINSYDYPAMYSNVVASGKKSTIKFKDIDYSYASSNIIYIGTGVKLYEGNSYLSVLTLIRKSTK